MRELVKLCLMLFVVFHGICGHADATLLARKDVQMFVTSMVNQYHFNRADLNNVLKQAVFQPKIIESMERPYEKKTWDVYKNLFLTSARVDAGISFWKDNQRAIEYAQAKYNVPANIIVAIIGVETLYGRNQGSYRVLDALTTLAFDYPKRSEFFSKELREYLLLCREHGVSATKYMGSYAGAMGKPQFMPSSYRFYAVKGQGAGIIDLMNEDRDVVSSVANYFHKHGWVMNEPVAQPAIVRGWRYKHLVTNSKFPNYTLKYLMSSGVRPVSYIKNHPTKAGVIELFVQNGMEYWIAYHNFYVITHYNTSPQYALVVYLLAQDLQNRWKLDKKA